MAKAQNIWNKTKYAGTGEKINEVLENEIHKNLDVPVVVRWNTLHNALECLLDLGEGVILKLTITLDLPAFEKKELRFLKEYQMILKPLADLINRLQGQNNCYYGCLIPELRTCESKVKKLDTTVLEFCSPMADELLKSLKRRFGDVLSQERGPNGLFSETAEHAMIATISHPRFKRGPIREENRQWLTEEFIRFALYHSCQES